MTQSEEQPQPLDGGRLDLQLSSLVTIKNDIIGHGTKKPTYTDQRFVRAIVSLIKSTSTLSEVKIEGTAILGSLFHGTFPAILRLPSISLTRV
jgi:hypothetical protein